MCDQIITHKKLLIASLAKNNARQVYPLYIYMYMRY